jgi:hypothetical protein
MKFTSKIIPKAMKCLLVSMLMMMMVTSITDMLNSDHKITSLVQHRPGIKTGYTDSMYLAEEVAKRSSGKPEPLYLVIDMMYDKGRAPSLEKFAILMTIGTSTTTTNAFTLYNNGVVPSKSVFQAYWAFQNHYFSDNDAAKVAWNLFLAADDSGAGDSSAKKDGKSDCIKAVKDLKFEVKMNRKAYQQHTAHTTKDTAFGYDEAYYPGWVMSLYNSLLQSRKGQRCLNETTLDAGDWFCYKNIVDSQGKLHARFCIKQHTAKNEELHWWDGKGASYKVKKYEFRHQGIPVYEVDKNNQRIKDKFGAHKVKKWRMEHIEKYDTFRVTLNLDYEGRGDGTDEGWRKDAAHRPWIGFPSMCHFVPPKPVANADRPCIAEAVAASETFTYLDDTDYTAWFNEIKDANGHYDNANTGNNGTDMSKDQYRYQVMLHMEKNRTKHIANLKRCMTQTKGEVYEEVSFCYTAAFIAARKQHDYNNPGKFEKRFTEYMKEMAFYGAMLQMEEHWKENYRDKKGNKPLPKDLPQFKAYCAKPDGTKHNTNTWYKEWFTSQYHYYHDPNLDCPTAPWTAFKEDEDKPDTLCKLKSFMWAHSGSWKRIDPEQIWTIVSRMLKTANYISDAEFDDYKRHTGRHWNYSLPVVVEWTWYYMNLQNNIYCQAPNKWVPKTDGDMQDQFNEKQLANGGAANGLKVDSEKINLVEKVSQDVTA